MCGIAGFWGQGNRDDIARMIATLKHRGPDDTGVVFEQGVALGHARLSILDLSPAGHQPMALPDKSLSIVFNGEIYNFQELRADLARRGVRFVSTTDTEVILHLYKTFGVEAFAKMNGMFALALYDAKIGELILARDRLGKKPLYWSVTGGTLLFGSELKALMAHPSFRKEIDLVSLQAYIANDSVPTPRSIYQGVAKLPPGSYLSYMQGAVPKIETFWKREKVTSVPSFADATALLDTLLFDSVQKRMVADVPVGVFLSGGLDSSLVAYFATRASSRPIETFSIGFEEASFDESNYARLVARHLGTNHHERLVRPGDLLAEVHHVADMLDEPLADASIIPTSLLSRFARESVTVALGGDGGDELCAGYPTFQVDGVARAYQMLPTFLTENIIEPLVAHLPANDTNFHFAFKAQKFIEGAKEIDPARRHALWLGTFGQKERDNLFVPEVSATLKGTDAYQSFVNAYAEASFLKDAPAQLLHMYARTYLMDGVMVKVDRASMRYALEARSPLLDYRIVEFMEGLPYSYKYRFLRTKRLLKTLMKGRLPDEIIERKKKGFGLPIARWLKAELRPWMEELLSKEAVARRGLFDYASIAKLKNDHIFGRRDNRKQLWNLLAFALWYDRWHENKG